MTAGRGSGIRSVWLTTTIPLTVTRTFIQVIVGCIIFVDGFCQRIAIRS